MTRCTRSRIATRRQQGEMGRHQEAEAGVSLSLKAVESGLMDLRRALSWIASETLRAAGVYMQGDRKHVRLERNKNKYQGARSLHYVRFAVMLCTVWYTHFIAGRGCDSQLWSGRPCSHECCANARSVCLILFSCKSKQRAAGGVVEPVPLHLGVFLLSGIT